MIFVTVGAQMPFDRLVRLVDDWAGANGRDDVFAQIGRTHWRPRHMEWTDVLTPVDFRARVFDAEVIITHAGMGTIITALEIGRPLLVYPRRMDRQETRNDHQIGTARRFEEDGRITVAWSEADLASRLERIESIPVAPRIPSHASPRLLTTVRRFIDEEQIAPAVEPRLETPALLHPAVGLATAKTDEQPRRAA